ncbi:universal stress protein [Halioglobus maricola]|uniref:Universal stress protein n=1 Tax=Halioglobus maricola TaxID=2601894 RepID=A0A5P9NKS1_9GAMM|nr:universal stress protein [Halioglobus maricola]QFU75834.1 universal stress protein [Halioglobus maricola]
MGKLLIVADLEGKGIATRRGLDIAARHGFDAEVVSFVYAPLKSINVSAEERVKIKQKLIEDKRLEVQGRVDESAKQGQKVKLTVVWEKDLAAWVSRRCTSTRYEMVVKTGRRSDTLAHTSTDWQLLRECPAPVLVIAENKWARTKPVLAALDLRSKVAIKKKLNVEILQRAAALASAMDTSVEIVSAIEVPVLLADLDLVDPATFAADAKRDMQPQIKALAKQFGIPEKRFVVKRGPVEKVIASQAAAKRAQIVVMGTVGRKGVKARLMGNTAERVLRHLRTDVLALKP